MQKHNVVLKDTPLLPRRARGHSSDCRILLVSQVVGLEWSWHSVEVSVEAIQKGEIVRAVNGCSVRVVKVLPDIEHGTLDMGSRGLITISPASNNRLNVVMSLSGSEWKVEAKGDAHKIASLIAAEAGLGPLESVVMGHAITRCWERAYPVGRMASPPKRKWAVISANSNAR